MIKPLKDPTYKKNQRKLFTPRYSWNTSKVGIKHQSSHNITDILLKVVPNTITKPNQSINKFTKLNVFITNMFLLVSLCLCSFTDSTYIHVVRIIVFIRRNKQKPEFITWKNLKEQNKLIWYTFWHTSIQITAKQS
jgi:hypothetical protein